MRELEAERDDCLVAVLQASAASASARARSSTGTSGRCSVAPSRPTRQRREGEPLRLSSGSCPPSGSTTTATPTTAATWSSSSERRRRVHALHRRRRGVPDRRSLLLHRREPPHLRRPEPRRRPLYGSTLVLLAHDEKRFHVFTSIVRREDDGIDTLIGTAEHLLLHVDTVADRVVPADAAVLDRSPGRRSARRDRPSGRGRSPRRPAPLTGRGTRSAGTRYSVRPRRSSPRDPMRSP